VEKENKKKNIFYAQERQTDKNKCLLNLLYTKPVNSKLSDVVEVKRQTKSVKIVNAERTFTTI
jgi:hypothetical protein